MPEKCTSAECEYLTDGHCTYEKFLNAKRPCPAGSRCDFSSARKKPRSKTTMRPLSEKAERRLRMLAGGMTVKQIAEAEGANIGPIYDLIYRIGLKAKFFTAGDLLKVLASYETDTTPTINANNRSVCRPTVRSEPDPLTGEIKKAVNLSLGSEIHE